MVWSGGVMIRIRGGVVFGFIWVVALFVVGLECEDACTWRDAASTRWPEKSKLGFFQPAHADVYFFTRVSVYSGVHRD